MGAAAAPEKDLVLAGRYRLETRLGAGGMGAIWKAEHLVLRATVAVKLLERDAPPDEDTVARFLREAQAAASLRSPHVVQIIDYGVDGRWPFIVMELLEGETLAQRIKRKKRLGPEETVRILAHVGRAMGKAHEAGIVHRDLKPENVFLVHNEDEEIAKVLDFGVAKVSSTALGAESARTRTGSILGTPYYMSPEQAQGNKMVDHRSDLWSLAVIAYECLTGRRPFFSDGLGDLVLQICIRDIPVPSEAAPVPIGFDAWWRRAVAREPELRFQNAREMIDALRDALGLERDRSSDPDIVVSSSTRVGEGLESDPPVTERPPQSKIPTVLAGPNDGPLVPTRVSEADGHAVTVVAPISDLTPERGGAPSPATEEIFGTSQVATPKERKTSLGPVLGVAALALGVGLAAGFTVLDAEPARQAALSPAPVATRSAAVPRPKAAVTRKPLDERRAAMPSVLPPAEPSARDGEAAALTKPSAPSSPAATPSAGKPPASPSVRAAAPTAPDAGWVKPAWAIPDEEPIRRAPSDSPAP